MKSENIANSSNHTSAKYMAFSNLKYPTKENMIMHVVYEKGCVY
jgi:hypothetical protein